MKLNLSKNQTDRLTSHRDEISARLETLQVAKKEIEKISGWIAEATKDVKVAEAACSYEDGQAALAIQAKKFQIEKANEQMMAAGQEILRLRRRLKDSLSLVNGLNREIAGANHASLIEEAAKILTPLFGEQNATAAAREMVPKYNLFNWFASIPWGSYEEHAESDAARVLSAFARMLQGQYPQ